MGTGDWLRGKTEHCILAVRGQPTVTLTNQTTLLDGPVREHSRKPEEFYALVEALCPGSKVELFAHSLQLHIQRKIHPMLLVDKNQIFQLLLSPNHLCILELKYSRFPNHCHKLED
jgi:hypothetical protein